MNATQELAERMRAYDCKVQPFLGAETPTEFKPDDTLIEEARAERSYFDDNVKLLSVIASENLKGKELTRAKNYIFDYARAVFECTCANK